MKCDEDYSNLDFKNLGDMGSKQTSSTGVTRVASCSSLAAIVKPAASPSQSLVNLLGNNELVLDCLALLGLVDVGTT